MADKIIASLALAMFVVFVGFLAVYVNEIDLWIVLIVVLALAIFDFWQTLRAGTD